MDKIKLLTEESPFKIIDASVMAPGIGGSDAVTAFYHSGHGAMDNNGVSSIPTGACLAAPRGRPQTRCF